MCFLKSANVYIYLCMIHSFLMSNFLMKMLHNTYIFQFPYKIYLHFPFFTHSIRMVYGGEKTSIDNYISMY